MVVPDALFGLLSQKTDAGRGNFYAGQSIGVI